MNALDGLHHSGRMPFSPGFRRHAGMARKSDRGDKKHGEDFSAMACMQSHTLWVNCCEVTQRTTEDSGCLASRHMSTSKLSPNLTHNIGVQLPLVCRWPAHYPHPVCHLWAPKHRRLLLVGDSLCHSYSGLSRLDGKSPRSRLAGITPFFRILPESHCSGLGCLGWRDWSWTGWEPGKCLHHRQSAPPVWSSLKLEDQKEGKKEQLTLVFLLF